MATLYYKWTALDGSSCNGGSGKWPLPTQLPDGSWKPGAWRHRIRDIVPCSRGYHLCREQDLLWWIGPALWEAEADGDLVEHGSAETGDTKIVVGRARLLRPVTTWNERTARLFAADCAEQVLPLFETRHPDDDRPRRAIGAARAYADGTVTADELAAARDAARAAAGAAAWAAARDAAGAAAGAAAWAAARYAARDAAWYAARDAAWYAARDAAGEWQRTRLMEYIAGARR